MKYYISFIILILITLLIIYFYSNQEVKKVDLNPEIYIYTKSDISDNYIYANMDVYENNNVISFNDILIKLRGNSTRSYDKKPYSLKFNSDISLLGLNISKRYNLISNGYDETLMRNKMVYDFANNTKLPYSVSSRYVDVYLNDEYIGNYLLTDKVEVSNSDYFLEYEAYRDQPTETYFVTNKYNWRFNVHEGNDLNRLMNFFDEFETALESKNYAIISKYADIDSLIDSYIMLEYFKDVDCNFSSLYFYIKDNKLYAGPLWDFDLSMGVRYPLHSYNEYNNRNNLGNNSGNSYEGLYCNRNIYGELLKTDKIRKIVIRRYHNLQPLIRNLYTTDTLKYSVIDQYNKFYRSYYDKNNIIWQSTWVGEESYEECLLYLKNWLRLRNEWLLSEYHIDYY